MKKLLYVFAVFAAVALLLGGVLYQRANPINYATINHPQVLDTRMVSVSPERVEFYYGHLLVYLEGNSNRAVPASRMVVFDGGSDGYCLHGIADNEGDYVPGFTAETERCIDQLFESEEVDSITFGWALEMGNISIIPLWNSK